MSGDAIKHAFDADVLVDIRPMYSLTGPDKTEIRPLLPGGLRQSPRPSKRHADYTTVGEVRDDLVLCDAHVLDARVVASRNVHAMPLE